MGGGDDEAGFGEGDELVAAGLGPVGVDGEVGGGGAGDAEDGGGLVGAFVDDDGDQGAGFGAEL